MLCWMACEVMEFSCFSAMIVFIAWPSMELLMSKNLRMVEIYIFLGIFGKYSELLKGRGGFEDTSLFFLPSACLKLVPD